MIERYTRPEMAEIWSDEGRFRRWLQVEVAVCEVHAERGLIPSEDLEAIRSRASFDVGRIDEIEREVRHDVISFLTSVAENIGPASRWVHFGMTSSDVIDTGMALQIRDAGRLLLDGVDRLAEVLKNRAHEFRHTPCIGRTHGIHAEPTTFGLKLLVFYAEMRRHRKRLATALDEAAVGKLSGAVGTFAHLPPELEEAVCRSLGIGFEPAATQVVQRDRHAAFISALAQIAASLEKFSVEFRHLARTEVREVEEEFGAGQKGSSAMPHKRNPWRLENVSGLARVVRGYAVAALENVPLWHERDISNSSVERVIFPDAAATVDFMLHRLAGLVETLVVHQDRMRANLELTRGLAFSGTLLLALTEKGLSREAAYGLVQRHAMDTWDKGGDYRDRLLADPAITETLSKEEVDRAFSLEQSLRHVDAIFERTLRDAGRREGSSS
jgi:adenylosuccinate lyase